VQQEDAGLRGHGDADLVGHLQPARALEALFLQEHLHVPLQLGPVLRGEPPVQGKAALQDRPPLGGKGLRADLFPPPALEEVEHGATSSAGR
jgi:hypothetical protein